MKLVTSPAAVQAYSQELRTNGLTIGLVPTMGWFHDGHLALMRKAKALADKVIVSLFVNPMQFGPAEDLDNYPYDLDRDCGLAEELGVDLLYAPDKDAMYSDVFATTVHVEGLTSGLCGGDRPGHFDGVTTVVAKLFNQTQPHLAVFGEKDFQQLAVIRQMAKDLDFPIEIVGHPIIREESGLAMSSRNTYLKEGEMAAALSLFQGITRAREMAGQEGTVTARQIKDAVTAVISSHLQCAIDYVELVDKTSLQACESVNSKSRLLIAVKINNRIRLIDNSTLFGNK
jgi:pantoate--beta-alanine ligase